MMKKRILHIWLLAVLLAAGAFCTTAYAEEISVSLVCEEQVAAGSSFSSALDYSGVSFGTAAIDVTFDPQVLEFRSCSGGEGFLTGEGAARITLNGGDGKSYLSCKIRFHALAEGESFITVTADSLTDFEGRELIAETRSVKVTVVPESLEVSGSGTESGVYEEKQETVQAEGGLLGLYAWFKSGIEEGTFMQQAKVSLRGFIDGLSITEFLVLCLCVSVILLLSILLSAERRKGKR
jgi:hypothetical protein